MLSQTTRTCQYHFFGLNPRNPAGRRFLVLSSRCARDDVERPGRLAADPQLGDEAVAVAPVDRDGELDHVTTRRAGDALEQESGRVERHAEGLRFLFAGYGRLDSLLAADDLDPVAAREQTVERVLLEVRRGQA